MSENQITCNRCEKTFLEWKFDEVVNKSKLWDISKRYWHQCEQPATVIHEKKIFWYCWECSQKIDVNNHPCLHYQKLDPGKRAMLKQKPGKKI